MQSRKGRDVNGMPAVKSCKLGQRGREQVGGVGMLGEAGWLEMSEMLSRTAIYVNGITVVIVNWTNAEESK